MDLSDGVLDGYLSDRDRRVIEAAGYDERGASSWESREEGTAPAVLVIDMQRITVGDDVDILDAVEQSPIAMGEVAWDAMDHIVPFVEQARDQGVPIVYTRVVPGAYDDPDHPDLGIVEPLAPAEDDAVVDKSYSSAFFGSDLLARLVREDVDTVFTVGNTTSGCLRATVVDAQQLGFDVVVPKECVFDRLELSHAAALLDMWMKYATVITADAALEKIDELTDSPT